ncbi:MAG TPA: hypothetical protein VHD38_00015 [Candidatus Paceibacterota bacterium]|nr:hypothetical protein [Candidatus Paceibacterota bacterium]
MRRVPHAPMMPGQMPHFPDIHREEDEDEPEIDEEVESTTIIGPNRPKPEMDKPFEPDLEEKDPEIEKIKKDIIEKKKLPKTLPPGIKKPDDTVH